MANLIPKIVLSSDISENDPIEMVNTNDAEITFRIKVGKFISNKGISIFRWFIDLRQYGGGMYIVDKCPDIINVHKIYEYKGSGTFDLWHFLNVPYNTEDQAIKDTRYHIEPTNHPGAETSIFLYEAVRRTVVQEKRFELSIEFNP